MTRLTLMIMLLSLFITSACVPLAPTANVSAGDAATDAVTVTQHELLIIATAEGWDAPETIAAGWTRITLDNQSDGLRQAAFLRLDDDKDTG